MKIIAIAGRMGTGKDTVAEILGRKGYVRVALADQVKRLARSIFDFSTDSLFGPSALRNEPVRLTHTQWCEVFYRAGSAREDIQDTIRAGLSSAEAEDGGLYDDEIESAVVEYLRTCRLHDLVHDNFSVRVALQLLGTELGRKLRDDVWIANLREKIEDVTSYSVAHMGANLPGVIITDCRFPNEAAAFKSWGGEVYWIDASKRLVIPPSMHASEPDRHQFEGLLTGVIDNNGTLEDLEKELDRVTG